ncbi:hypothetical protein BDC45DRAFT_523091, partial [Circinella umbellata]
MKYIRRKITVCNICYDETIISLFFRECSIPSFTMYINIFYCAFFLNTIPKRERQRLLHCMDFPRSCKKTI